MSRSESPENSSLGTLTLAAFGVVFGDIGTSPLYAIRVTFGEGHGIALNVENILGGLSTIFWALMIAVSLKYVTLIMRADNDGEGGVLALAALAHRTPGLSRRMKTVIGLSAIVGLALFYGGLVRSKNMLSVLMQVFYCVCIVVILYALYGYSLSFTGGSDFIGGFSKAFLMGVTTDSKAATFSVDANISELIYICFQMTFAAANAPSGPEVAPPPLVYSPAASVTTVDIAITCVVPARRCSSTTEIASASRVASAYARSTVTR